MDRPAREAAVDSGAQAVEPREEAAARDRAAWLLRLRSAAVVAILVPLVIGAASNQLPDAGKLWLLVGVVGAANATLFLRRAHPWAWSGGSLLAQVVLDVIALTLALHLTGGVENPFQVYYLFPVIVSGVVLPARQSYAVSALSALGFGGVATLEYAGAISHHDVAILPFWSSPDVALAADQYRDLRYIAGASGVLLSTIAFACSITTSLVERLRRGERELAVEKSKLEAVLRAMGEGVAYFDEGGALAFANESFRASLGASPPERLFLLAPGALREGLEAARARLESGAAFHAFEVEERGRTLASGISAVREPLGTRLVGIVWLIEDVTSRRQAQRENERQARLADLGVLAAGIAHEVLNPLASIASTTSLLEATVPGAAVRSRTQQVKRNVERIGRIVRGIADLARSPSFGGPVPLDDVLADAVARAREERPREGVEIETTLPRPSPQVRGAEEPLVQVFHNLVKNALDAVPEKGHVRVAARVAEGSVVVEVEDDGPGVPPESREKVFLPFYTTKEPGAGAGLGLAIAASIVRRHGGSIEVGTGERGGARFVVRLPAATAALQGEARSRDPL